MPLSSDSSGFDILRNISKDPSLRLLLDVGALMLNLDNENVAKEWLKLCPDDIEAAVFFKDNDLVVVTRRGEIIDFEMSTYRRHLEHCVIYLDDSHTRGTDLKIPRGTVGAVTLGKGVSKDRLMQACMRMRMLGDGHSVCFYASHEVHNQILKISEGESQKIGSLEVIKWAIQNTSNQTVENFLYWASQGLSFYRRESIRSSFEGVGEYKKYADHSVENENLDITNLYDPDRIYNYMKDIISQRADVISGKLKIEPQYSRSFLKCTRNILSNLEQFVGLEKKHSQLHDEEQEVELEVEQEQETEVQRPKELVKFSPTLDNCVVKFVRTGILDNSTKKFVHLPLSLKDSSIFKKIQAYAWSPLLYTSEDFTNTVTKNIHGDDFLRPPRWVAVRQDKANLIIVILSAFEAGMLKSNFKENCVSLIMLIPRVRQKQLKLFTEFNNIVPQTLLEQLSVFAGSQYFDTWEEQEAHLSFIGYCPGPRTPLQQECFEKKFILKNGFVPAQRRDQVFQESRELYENSKFKEDPIDIVQKLVEIRNYGIVSKFAHHLLILLRGRKPIEKP